MIENGIRDPSTKGCREEESIPDPWHEATENGLREGEGGGELTMDRRDEQSSRRDHPSHLGQPSFLHLPREVREDRVRDHQIEELVHVWGRWVRINSPKVCPLKMLLAPSNSFAVDIAAEYLRDSAV
jgi:hypothetical protein